jgi:hypothetical protein
MLQYSKSPGRRLQSITDVENQLKPIAKKMEII